MRKVLFALIFLTACAPLYAESQNPNPSGAEFPKVKTSDDEHMAKKFSWWPSDSKPAPYKDPERSGFWWWPDQPGEARPWGNQGFIYVRKLIFDYKSAEGEMRPSLIIKRILKNVKVHFDFDKSDLRDDTVDILSKAVFTLERNPNADLLITGNADVRGTEQYNVKLGERRAEAVKDYMRGRGIAESRIRILSRGKLDALAPVNDIVGMQKDRNAQFMVAEVEEVMLPASQASLYEDKEKVIEEKQEIEGEVRVSFKEYVIEKGDTLWGIAKREYGDGNQWRRIYNFNRDVISNPDRPKKGVKIRIPIE
ncbi:MAG: OmpA family protein [Candidatus Omnitrophota bacterium]